MACSNPHCERRYDTQEMDDTARCANCQALPAGTLVRRRYQIEQMLGRGGFGNTYLVNDQDCFNESRVLKELRPNVSGSEIDSKGNRRTAERLFKREAEMLLKLQHPGIPGLYAYFVEGDYSYLVQDFIPGKTLWEEIEERRQPLDEQEALSFLADLADILEYLHTLSPPVIHRDIKPQNLMRHSSGQLLLIDFGAVCQAASSTASNRTLIGTPGFAPVEQIFGQPVPGSDLYAAGVTVLCLLSGAQPNQLFNSDAQRRGWESRIRISPQFSSIVKSLLVQDVNSRLSSTTELKSRLEELSAQSSAAKEEINSQTLLELMPTVLYGEKPPEKELQLQPSEKSSDDIELMKSRLGDFSRKLTTTRDPLLLYQAVNLNPREAFIVSRIDSIMSIEEILSLGCLPEAETLRTLCGLLATGILIWADSGENNPQVRPQQPLLSDFNIQKVSAFCYEVEHTWRSIENANFYGVLGIERKASSREIEEAYTRMARRFHPDQNSNLAGFNMNLRTELEKISSRLFEAYRVLSDPRARQEYDSGFPVSKKMESPARIAKIVLRMDN